MTTSSMSTAGQLMGRNGDRVLAKTRAALLQAPRHAHDRLSVTQRSGARVYASNDTVQVLLATTVEQVDQALALRQRVFVKETGAKVSARGNPPHRRDIFDPYCDHLIALETATGRVVGTCRLLLPDKASALGCLDSDSEFWLTRLNSIRDQIVEVGQVCVFPDHRNGATIRLLWSALLAHVENTGQRYVVGSASVSLADGPDLAIRLYRHLSLTSMADEPLRTWPRQRLPMLEQVLNTTTLLRMPPLIKSYMRMGARLLGEPHHDLDFGTAQFPLIVDMWAMNRALLDRVKG